ncbi:hypothetical protein D9M70_323270 [compost metagenome]
MLAAQAITCGKVVGAGVASDIIECFVDGDSRSLLTDHHGQLSFPIEHADTVGNVDRLLVCYETATTRLDEMPWGDSLTARIQRQFHVERTGHGFDMVTIVCSRGVDCAGPLHGSRELQGVEFKPVRAISLWRFSHRHCQVLKLGIGLLPALQQCVDRRRRKGKAGGRNKLVKVVGVFTNQQAGSALADILQIREKLILHGTTITGANSFCWKRKRG